MIVTYVLITALRWILKQISLVAMTHPLSFFGSSAVDDKMFLESRAISILGTLT
jgi:hypothetical protein